MTQQFIGPSTQPELKTLLDQMKRQTMLAINCVQIGTIQQYKPATNTAKVKINFQIKMPNDAIIEYPILDDCPVFTLSGGTSFVSCPIAVGDNCLVLFNDRNIDNWYLTGAVTTHANNRSHSIADGIVLVGLNPISSPKVTPLNSVCVNGGSKKVSIKNTATDLKTVLSALIDAISAITVVTGGVTSTVPVNIAVFTALKATLATLLDEGAI
jgi:uncharacterized protein YbaR (Trm112 family)/ACT domain-containing protein